MALRDVQMAIAGMEGIDVPSAVQLTARNPVRIYHCNNI